MPIDTDGSPTVDASPELTSGASSNPSVETSTSDASAPSSSAPQGETKEDLLSAVLSALPETALKSDTDKLTLDEDAPASTQPKSEDQAAAEADAEVDLDKDPTKEELSRYHSRTRKRIEKLLNERNSFRDEAQVAKGLREYLVQNDVSKEDFQLTLDLAVAMRKGDFRSFLEGVAPYVQLAQEALGITLPQDLQQQVQQGFMTTEAAGRMSQERYARMIAEQNAQKLAYQQQAQQASQQRTQITQSVEQAVAAWETSVKQSDPDYGRKEDAVKNFLWAVVRERGAPQTPQQAVEIAQEAYARANNTLRSFMPTPKPTKQVPSSINRTVGARPEPKSLMEAAMIGLERARR